jgi:hypothetical protein
MHDGTVLGNGAACQRGRAVHAIHAAPGEELRDVRRPDPVNGRISQELDEVGAQGAERIAVRLLRPACPRGQLVPLEEG